MLPIPGLKCPPPLPSNSVLKLHGLAALDSSSLTVVLGVVCIATVDGLHAYFGSAP